MAVAFFGAVFFAAVFFAAVCLAAVFLVELCLAGVCLAEVCLVALCLAAVLFPVVPDLAAVFFAAGALFFPPVSFGSVRAAFRCGSRLTSAFCSAP